MDNQDKGPYCSAPPPAYDWRDLCDRIGMLEALILPLGSYAGRSAIVSLCAIAERNRKDNVAFDEIFDAVNATGDLSLTDDIRSAANNNRRVPMNQLRLVIQALYVAPPIGLGGVVLAIVNAFEKIVEAYENTSYTREPVRRTSSAYGR